jgi:thiamine biosynthesis lipoprotein
LKSPVGGPSLLPLLALALGCAAAPPAAPAPASATLSDGRYVMGTVLELTLHGPEPAALARARDRAFALAERLEARVSRYREDSDVARLNAAAGGAAVAVTPGTAALLRAALGHARRTRGAFDVTVGPLVELWTRAARDGALPGEAELAATRARVGPGHVHVGDDDRVRLDAGSAVDLGGIAKGWALDRMLPALREEGVTAALLSFGQSSVQALGAPPDAPGWRLLARAPGGGFAGVVVLWDAALSVSGSLGQGSEIAGRRFGHVLDPRSGWPLERRRQALVVAPSGELAEVLSTALLVLGEDEGLALVARSEGCEALLLDADGRRWSTPGWQRATAFEPVPGGAAAP